MLISTSYLPPVWYMNAILNSDEIIFDTGEHFVKQTIRNRCHILSPNGIQTLVIPTIHQNRSHTAVKDIRISNDQPWQRQHWRSLDAAYRRSAYFEFYMDEMAPWYEKKFEFLFDFNLELMALICHWMKIEFPYSIKEEYVPPPTTDSVQIISSINTGQPASLNQKRYPQVFSSKFGFTTGLSIVDLIFNMGPVSGDYLNPQ